MKAFVFSGIKPWAVGVVCAEDLPSACEALGIEPGRVRDWKGPFSPHTPYSVVTLEPGEVEYFGE